MQRSPLLGFGAAVLLLGCSLACGTTASATGGWTKVWADEFTGAENATVDKSRWLFDLGTQYPGGPARWGTDELEIATDSTQNVYLDGKGHLVIKAIKSGGDWTSGRIETHRADFAAPVGGVLAVEASIQQPNVTPDDGAGYWPAFWMLGASFRGTYTNWPGIGEIDIMEDINGLNSEFATIHCGTYPGGPCHEPTGIGSGKHPCAKCQTGFHTYRMELDRTTSPERIRWFLDGVKFFSVDADQVGAATWAAAFDHGFFIILDLAIGGAFPAAFGGGPTAATVSGASLVVDYVRVFTKGG
jgi:beta-glucanase (GH16 family)